MKLAPSLLALTLSAPAVAQVTIDARGIRTGGTTIDASGVHTGATSIGRTGVHSAANGAARVINDNNATQRVDCGGGTLTVAGNGNRLYVANCRTVTVAGNRNVMDVRYAAPSTLTVAGNDDRVSYSAPAGVAVSVSNVGTRSSVARR